MRIIITFLALSISAHAQQSLTDLLAAKKIWPGPVVHLKDSTFIGDTETTWAEYSHFVRASPAEMQEYLGTFLKDVQWPLESYSLTGWRSIDTVRLKRDPVDGVSFFYPPALGITYEQAHIFCLWLSKFYTAQGNRRLIAAGDSLRVTYTFRLPTEAEWRLAAGDIKQYEKYIPMSRFTRRALRKSNIKDVKKTILDLTVRQSLVNNDNGDFVYDTHINFPGPVHSHFANERECGNMIGNVAEMVQERGVALGGSWKDSFDEIVRSDLKQSYSCPESWLGFRYACDVSLAYHTLPDTVYNFITPKHLDSCDIVARRREELLLMTAQRKEEILLKTDVQHNILRLREWVRNNKLISLSMDTIYVDGIATSSLDQINIVKHIGAKIRIAGGYDSMLVNFGGFGTPDLYSIASLRMKRNPAGEFEIRNPLDHHSNTTPAAVMFMIVYHENRQRILCRMVVNPRVQQQP